MPIPQASSQWGEASFVPESAWGRMHFFSGHSSLVNGSNIDAWEGAPI